MADSGYNRRSSAYNYYSTFSLILIQVSNVHSAYLPRIIFIFFNKRTMQIYKPR